MNSLEVYRVSYLLSSQILKIACSKTDLFCNYLVTNSKQFSSHLIDILSCGCLLRASQERDGKEYYFWKQVLSLKGCMVMYLI